MDEIAATIFWFIVFCVGAAVFAFFVGDARCASKARAMQLTERSYGPLQGCIVKYKGEYIDIGRVGVRTIVD